MKRIISLITAVVLVWNIAVGAAITAAAEKANEHEYVYSDYSVLYTVVSEWSGYQSVEVRLTNTGEESLFGWGLKFDVGGTIDNIWNAKILKQTKTEYIVKGESYARILAPGESASFGYVLSCDSPEMPAEIVLCNDWRTAEDVEISYEITGDWTSSYQAVVTIANNGKSDVEAWKLAFSHTGNIKNLWTDDVLSDADGKTLVASSNSSAIIKKGESYAFSFIAEKDAEESAELSDFVFTENYINTEKQPEAVEPLYVYGYSEFEDGELKILWYSSVEEGTFSVAQSKNNVDYKEIFSAEKAYEYTYGKIDFEENYFKITQALSDGRSAESPVFVVKYDQEKDDCEVELLDSDGEGLPDVFEETYGTDPMKKDTDEDGLTDYEEIYLTGTDPLVYNSVNEALSDAEADSDGDGLSNREELDLGTNPLNPDMDGDGLTDGEEVKLGTDPLNPDTDGDRIPDGDEIKLKLDPTSDTTDGIKDSERTTEQEIAADSEILSQINTDENPMKVSIELEAAGLAETSLSVNESGYASAISNSAVVGAIPEFTYTDGLSTGEVTVKFTADKSVRKNTVGTYAEGCDELKGIKRLNVFKYFEDTNILLPIETFHDEENGTVSAKTDCLGTYCVMDLEVWMKNLGVEPVSDSEGTETVRAAYAAGAAENAVEKVSGKFDVVFYLDTRASVDKSEFEKMKALIRDTCSTLLKEKDNYSNLGDLILYTFDSNGRSSTHRSINGTGDLDEIMKYSQQKNSDSKTEIFDVTSALDNVLQTYSRKNTTLLFMVTDNNDVLARANASAGVYNKLLESDNIRVSFVLNGAVPDEESYIQKIIEATVGAVFDTPDAEEVKQYILSFLIVNTYKIITANNYEPVALDAVLRRDSQTDTDKDELYDWNEVNTEAIYTVKEKLPENEGGDKELRKKPYLLMDDMPTIQQFIAYYGMENLYVESGFERFRNDEWADGMPSSAFEEHFDTVLNERHITPIWSDPTNVDSDEDGLLDNEYQYDKNKNIIAPKDQNPLKVDGPIGMWKKHIERMRSFEAPNKLDKWYGRTEFDSENTGTEGFDAFFAEIEFWLNKVSSDTQKIYIQASIWLAKTLIAFGDYKAAYNVIEGAVEALKECFPNEEEQRELAAGLGSRALNFKMDDQGMVIHSQHLSWQSIGGYNNFYDGVFRTFTNDNMDRLRLPFTISTPFKEFVSQELSSDILLQLVKTPIPDSTTTDLIVWAWHGDYLNLGAGAEIGIYFRPTNGISNPEGLDHYFAHPEFTVPMQLYLYNYEGENSIENIFAWEPREEQWWITGFNPKWVDRVDVKKQVAIGCVDFSKFTDQNKDNELYEALKDETIEREYEKTFVIFDDDNKKVWICWYWDKELKSEKN